MEVGGALGSVKTVVVDGLRLGGVVCVESRAKVGIADGRGVGCSVGFLVGVRLCTCVGDTTDCLEGGKVGSEALQKL